MRERTLTFTLNGPLVGAAPDDLTPGDRRKIRDHAAAVEEGADEKDAAEERILLAVEKLRAALIAEDPRAQRFVAELRAAAKAAVDVTIDSAQFQTIDRELDQVETALRARKPPYPEVLAFIDTLFGVEVDPAGGFITLDDPETIPRAQGATVLASTTQANRKPLPSCVFTQIRTRADVEKTASYKALKPALKKPLAKMSPAERESFLGVLREMLTLDPEASAETTITILTGLLTLVKITKRGTA